MGLSKRVQNFICVTFAAFLLMHSVLLVEATTQSELQERINQNQNQLNQISGQMDVLESQQEILDEQISDMNAELVNLYTSIDVLQDEITAKEQEIIAKEGEIEEAQAAYDEAKAEQGKLYSKIAELQDFIEHAIITEDTEDTSKVGTGSTVTVLDLDSNIEEKYKIVTTQESDPMNGCISDESPIGGGLFGHEAGDTVAIETPAGVINYRILSIEK